MCGELKLFRFGFGIAAHFREPAEIADDLPAFGFEEEPEVAGVDVLGVFSGKGFETPAEVFAAPGSETVAAGCVPEESECGKHVFVLIIGGRPGVLCDCARTRGGGSRDDCGRARSIFIRAAIGTPEGVPFRSVARGIDPWRFRGAAI